MSNKPKLTVIAAALLLILAIIATRALALRAGVDVARPYILLTLGIVIGFVIRHLTTLES